MGIIVKQASSTKATPEEAIVEIKQKLDDNSSNSLNLIFCSPKYDLSRLSIELREHFDNNVVCCTTSGEFSSDGINQGSIVGVSINSPELKFKKYSIDDLNSFDIKSAIKLFEDFKYEFNYDNNSSKCFGILLIDGLSMLEDKIIALLSKAFSPVKIVGGSAGDDMNFASTWIYNNGILRKGAATLVMIESQIPFKLFKTQYFEPSAQKLVITEADPAKRIVYEINGEKAAIEYANILNIPLEELNAQVFAKYPVMLNIGGSWYVRSIAKMNEDFSLTFFCAIDNGLVLTIAKSTDIVENYRNQFSQLKDELGELSLIIAFDCILRRFQYEQEGLKDQIDEIMRQNNIIGFNTYGEQCNAVHINQTLTGVAFGK